jgi:EmrB/QacA subfamily drug resistance transporter
MTPRPHSRWFLAVLLLGPFMAQVDATIANVATPSIASGLGASGAVLELVIGGYLIAFAVLLITGARLGQTHGYTRMFVLGMAVFSLASLACGLAPDAWALVAARVVQGAGAALMFPQTLTGIQRSFPQATRARPIGLYAIALSGGAVTGQILGGVLIAADVAGSQWRTIFLINVPIGLAAIVAAVRVLPRDGVRVDREIDVAGIGALSVAVLLAVLPLTLGRTEGWPLWTWACLAASIPAAGGFYVLERRASARGAAPLLEVRMLADRRVVLGLAAQLVATGTYYAVLFTLAQYLQQGLGRSALASGLTMVPWVIAFGVGGQIVRRLPPAVRRGTPTAGCAILTLAYAAASVALFAGDRSTLLLALLLGLGGLGLGLQFASLIAYLMTIVPSDLAADFSGVSTTTLQIGGALGVAAVGTLYLGQDVSGPGAATHAFAVATGVLAVVMLAATAAARLTTAAPR